MNLLFPVEPHFPEGFSYQPEFISRAEEELLMNSIADLNLHPFIFQGYEAKRKVASFGWDWSFEHQRLSKGKEIPENFKWFVTKVADKLCLPAEAIAELLVTEYPAGSLINWHRDAPPFDCIAGISLQADCTFRLRPYEEVKRKRNTTYLLQWPGAHYISYHARICP